MIDWFITQNAYNNKPSYAEQEIIEGLLKANILDYQREVSFKGCVYFNGSIPRFDFYLPSHNTVIEYDGDHHKEKTFSDRDDFKTKFCQEKGIKVIRFSKEDSKELRSKVFRMFYKPKPFKLTSNRHDRKLATQMAMAKARNRRKMNE